MKCLSFLIFVFASCIAIQAQTLTIKSATISFEFPSKNVEGTIEGFESTSRIDWENPTNSIFEGSVQVETLDTQNFLRNWSLRGGKYFDVKNHPKISFTSTSIQQKGTGWDVAGELTIKGITKPFQITFDRNSQKLIGRGSLYASDFDINIKKEREDNLVVVRFEFVLSE